jgi:hypothetical protein
VQVSLGDMNRRIVNTSSCRDNIEAFGAFPVKDSAQLFQKMSEVGAK